MGWVLNKEPAKQYFLIVTKTKDKTIIFGKYVGFKVKYSIEWGKYSFHKYF